MLQTLLCEKVKIDRFTKVPCTIEDLGRMYQIEASHVVNFSVLPQAK